MTAQIRREARVTVGGEAVRQGLDVAFRVERTRTREPNKCELRIWNLNADHRGQLQRLGKTDQVVIEAGYAGSIGEIFRGTVREASSAKERVDWVSVIEASDGGEAVRSSRINQSFPPGTTVGRVIEAVATKLGVGVGNATRALLQGSQLRLGTKGLGREFTEGTIVSGSVADELTRLLASTGFEWSVQGEQLQVVEIGAALRKPPVRLAAPGLISHGTGLVGSPEVGSNGVVRARALLNAELVPGRLVEIESRQVLQSTFGILRSDFLADTSGQDWYVDIECKEAA